MSMVISTIFFSTAIGITPANVPKDFPRDYNKYYLASRGPRVVHTPDDDKTPRQKRKDKNILFEWAGGAFAFA